MTRSPWSRRSFLGAAGLAAGGIGIPFAANPAAARAATQAAAGGGLGPVSMAMHLHASLSEGTASMDAHLDQATRFGIDVVWWTDHDFRMSAHGHTTAVGCGARVEGEATARWEWVEAKEGAPSAASAEFVADVHSPDEADGAMRLVASASGDALAGLWETGKPVNTLYSTSFFDTTLTLDVLAEELGEDAMLAVEIISSHHPAAFGRPAGRYRLRYLLGPTPPRDAMAPDPADPLLGVRVLPLAGDGPGGGWRRLTLRPVEDAAACWPGLVPGDNSLQQLRVGALSRRDARARVVVDRLRFDRSQREGDGPLRFQADMMRRYAPRYPAVRQYGSVEVSLWRHINWYGGDLELPDYGDMPPVRDTSPALAAAMVDRIHASGGLASLNHPGDYAPDGLSLGAHLLETGAHGVDTMEVGCFQYDTDQMMVAFDISARNALFYTATGASDAHLGVDWHVDGQPWVTSVWARSQQVPDLLRPLRAGRAWVWHADRWRGELDMWTEDGTPMGGVDMGGRRRVPVNATLTGLPADATVEVVIGEADLGGAQPAVQVTRVPASSVRHGRLGFTVERRGGRYVRLVVRTAAGTVAGFSNPIWLFPRDAGVDVPAARLG